MTDSSRTYPLRKPEGHVPPVPRWHLVLPQDASNIHTVYLGVQRHEDNQDSYEAEIRAIGAINTWAEDYRPDASETFTILDGNDVPASTVWVAYWISEQSFITAIQALRLGEIHNSLGSSSDCIGLWMERFSVEASRVETNYTGLDYLPGLGSIKGTSTERHTLTAYWGAARDRIPDSAHDLFQNENCTLEDGPLNGRGRQLKGRNAHNVVHIRSGQWWENCPEAEVESYERKLEPTLQAGLTYLLNNPVDTGTLGLRYLRNIPSVPNTANRPLKETCVAAMFTSLDALEGWAKGHKSHLAIYNGAMQHAKTFGIDRKFRTWHEVAVLKEGQGEFEYVNCREGTGVMGKMPLHDQ